MGLLLSSQYLPGLAEILDPLPSPKDEVELDCQS